MATATLIQSVDFNMNNTSTVNQDKLTVDLESLFKQADKLCNQMDLQKTDLSIYSSAVLLRRQISRLIAEF